MVWKIHGGSSIFFVPRVGGGSALKSDPAIEERSRRKLILQPLSAVAGDGDSPTSDLVILTSTP